MKYALRILALPFIATAALIGAIKLWVELCKNFLLYGGEVVTYTKDHTPTTLADVIYLLKEKLNSDKDDERSVATGADNS